MTVFIETSIWILDSHNLNSFESPCRNTFCKQIIQLFKCPVCRFRHSEINPDDRHERRAPKYESYLAPQSSSIRVNQKRDDDMHQNAKQVLHHDSKADCARSQPWARNLCKESIPNGPDGEKVDEGEQDDASNLTIDGTKGACSNWNDVEDPDQEEKNDKNTCAAQSSSSSTHLVEQEPGADHAHETEDWDTDRHRERRWSWQSGKLEEVTTIPNNKDHTNKLWHRKDPHGDLCST